MAFRGSKGRRHDDESRQSSAIRDTRHDPSDDDDSDDAHALDNRFRSREPGALRQEADLSGGKCRQAASVKDGGTSRTPTTPSMGRYVADVHYHNEDPMSTDSERSGPVSVCLSGRD
jgi:hypothetical protein